MAGPTLRLDVNRWLSSHIERQCKLYQERQEAFLVIVVSEPAQGTPAVIRA